MSKSIKVKIEKEISYEDIATLLEGAWKASNYWAEISPIEPIKFDYSKGKEKYYTEYPLNKGGGWWVTDKEEDKIYRVGIGAIRIGLKIMSQKAPNEWADFISDQGDMYTGDAFLQCCVLGDILYS